MIAALLVAVALSSPANEDFFIISSVDVAKSRLVLKRPTEVTVLATVTPSTEIRGEKREHLRLTDLRSGDTVYAVISPQLVISRMHRGPMTVEELHRRYLH